MARMVRKQVYITSAHEQLLKRRSRDLGVTEAELIRASIDQLARSAAPAPDPTAWPDLQRYIERRRRMNVPQARRSWTRDGLYEERIGRFTR